jgi:tagaturonate reductase
MASAACVSFLTTMLEREILPQLEQTQEEMRAYVATALQRFGNPCVQHRWHDIALNGLRKYRVRLLPHLHAQIERHGRPPRLLVLSLAAWLVFYLGRFAGSSAYPARDTDQTLSRLKEIETLDDNTEGGRLADGLSILEGKRILGEGYR